MKRIGVVLWAVGWGFVLFHDTVWTGRASPGSVSPAAWISGSAWTVSSWRWLLTGAALSLAAAFGRAAEWVYVGGAIWPFIYPGRSRMLIAGTMLLGTSVQWGIWIASFVRNRSEAAARHRSTRDAWLHDEEGNPVFTRDGAPLNRAAWRTLTPEAFEEELLDLFRAHGFDGQLTPLSGDEGIDLDLWKGGRYAVAQCKHYLKPVGQPALRDFAGAMRASGADAGYFITTSRFTEAAERWALALEAPRITLVDGRALVDWARDGRMPE